MGGETASLLLRGQRARATGPHRPAAVQRATESPKTGHVGSPSEWSGVTGQRLVRTGRMGAGQCGGSSPAGSLERRRRVWRWVYKNKRLARAVRRGGGPGAALRGGDSTGRSGSGPDGLCGPARSHVPPMAGDPQDTGIEVTSTEKRIPREGPCRAKRPAPPHHLLCPPPPPPRVVPHSQYSWYQ